VEIRPIGARLARPDVLKSEIFSTAHEMLMSRRLFRLLALALSLSFNGGCMCPSSNGYPDWGKYRAAELADRKGKVQPVIDALERYKQDNGKYPARLDDLITGRLLEAMPDLASNLDHTGAAGRIEKATALRYSPAEQDYRLRFDFSYTEQAWTTTKDIRMEFKPGPPPVWSGIVGAESRPASTVSSPTTKR